MTESETNVVRDVIAEALISFDSSEYEINSISKINDKTIKLELTVIPNTAKHPSKPSTQANAMVFAIAKALDLSNVNSQSVVVVDKKVSMAMSGEMTVAPTS